MSCGLIIKKVMIFLKNNDSGTKKKCNLAHVRIYLFGFDEVRSKSTSTLPFFYLWIATRTRTGRYTITSGDSEPHWTRAGQFSRSPGELRLLCFYRFFLGRLGFHLRLRFLLNFYRARVGLRDVRQKFGRQSKFYEAELMKD
jgi:hypothetical protein